MINVLPYLIWHGFCIELGVLYSDLRKFQFQKTHFSGVLLLFSKLALRRVKMLLSVRLKITKIFHFQFFLVKIVCTSEEDFSSMRNCFPGQRQIKKNSIDLVFGTVYLLLSVKTKGTNISVGYSDQRLCVSMLGKLVSGSGGSYFVEVKRPEAATWLYSLEDGVRQRSAPCS